MACPLLPSGLEARALAADRWCRCHRSLTTMVPGYGGTVMPPILSKPSNAARTAVVFITTGALIDVWSAIWWTYLNRHAEEHSEAGGYFCYGFLLTGLVLLVVGLAIGHISRNARRAELPPESPREPTAQPA